MFTEDPVRKRQASQEVVVCTFNPATLESQSSGFNPIVGNKSDVVGFQVWATWPGSVFRLLRQGLAVYPSWPRTNYMALVDKELPERAQDQLL